MQKLRCSECGKAYDFDRDDFCPKCGAFNQPQKRIRIGSDGAAIRSEGLNEKNHAGSFAHQEFHSENKVRRTLGLSKGVSRTAAPRPQRGIAPQRGNSGEWENNPMQVILWVILAVVAVNIITGFLFLF